MKEVKDEYKMIFLREAIDVAFVGIDIEKERLKQENTDLMQQIKELREEMAIENAMIPEGIERFRSFVQRLQKPVDDAKVKSFEIIKMVETLEIKEQIMDESTDEIADVASIGIDFEKERLKLENTKLTQQIKELREGIEKFRLFVQRLQRLENNAIASAEAVQETESTVQMLATWYYNPCI